MTRETIHSSKIAGRKRIYLDVLYDPDRAGRFFLWPHPTTEAFEACAWRVLSQRPIEHRVVSDLLLRQNKEFGAPPAAMIAASQLANPEAVAVFTGQQAGLFGGPLYTIYKSLTLIGWAERLQAVLHRPVVPVFWIAADDHDFQEVRWAGYPCRENTAQRLQLPGDELADRTPVNQINLGDRIAGLLEEFKECLIETEFSAAVHEALVEDYAPERTMVQAFGRWMARLLGPYGLVMFNPSDPAAKELCAPLFKQELEGHAKTAAVLKDIECRLEEAGYHRQVHHPEGHSHLFHVRNGRHALHAVDGRFWIDPEGEESASSTEKWLEVLKNNPAAFSSGVLLRPVVQSYLFPVVGAVCGPSEIAYWAQSRALFDRFGQTMPVVLPRSSATITERKITTAVESLGHTVCEFFGDIEQLINQHFERSFPTDLEKQFADERETWQGRLQTLKERVVSFEPTLAKTFEVTSGKMSSSLEHLERKVFQAHKRKGEEIRAKFYKLATHLYPEGQPQERVFNVTYYLNKYGFEFLDRVRGQLRIDTPDHQVIEP
jgi:bacillithiol biosynthesis cysteine-adding enzyme BshC